MWSNLWEVSCVLLLLGGLALMVSLGLTVYCEKKETYRRQAEARVVDIRNEPIIGESETPQFHDCQIAILQFMLGGRVITVRRESNRYPCPYRKNQKLTICYNPENPRDFLISGGSVRMIAARWLRCAGFALILTGIFVYFLYAIHQ